MAERRSAAAVLALLVTLLAGCASIPTSGPVVAGPAGGREADSGLRFQPARPADGASPRSIVRGFLLAASGVDDDHQVARSFLSPARQASWRPTTRTRVYLDDTMSLTLWQDGRELAADAEADPAGGQVTARLTATFAGVVDDRGRYAAQEPGTVADVDFIVGRVDGQWRIDALENQLVIDQAGFDLAYAAYALYFVDPTASFLVPETRWFPVRRSIATTLTAELVRGPSDWLAPAVRTGFPPGARLTDPAAVLVEEGEARVDLTRQALRAPPEDRALMQAQLAETLRLVPTISTVRMTVEQGELVLPVTRPTLVRDPVVDPQPVLVAGGRLARLRAGEPVPVEGLPPLDGLGISHPGAGPASYAVLAQQRSQLLHLVPGTQAPPQPLLTGADLTAPSLDPRSWIWSTSALCDGVVTAARADGDVAQVDAAWLAGRRVSSLRVSRDGTRVVVASTDAQGRGHVDLAAVERTADGRPVALSPASQGSTVPAVVQVAEAVWVGESQLAVLGRGAGQSGPTVHLVEAPGQVRPLRARIPDEAAPVTIAGGAGERSLLVATADGTLWQRAGAQWVEVTGAQGASDPAFAG